MKSWNQQWTKSALQKTTRIQFYGITMLWQFQKILFYKDFSSTQYSNLLLFNGNANGNIQLTLHKFNLKHFKFRLKYEIVQYLLKCGLKFLNEMDNTVSFIQAIICAVKYEAYYKYGV